MENFILSLNVISPLLILLVIGFALKKTGFLSDAVIKTMNRVVALVLLPLLVFKNIYQSDAGEFFNGYVLIFCAVAIFAEFFAAFFAVRFLTKDPKRKGVMLQGMFRSNYVIFGIPVAISLFGDSGSSAAAILTMVVIPIYNVMAVVALEIFGKKGMSIKGTLKKIVTNPLIIASVLGIIFSGFHITIPNIISKPIFDLASTATPLAFVFLGASFVFGEVKSHLKELIETVAARLIIFPLIVVSIAILLGFRDVWLVVILTVFASPTAVSSFSLAQTLGGDDKLAGDIVVFTSICSILTMFVWIFVLKSLAFI